MLRIMCKYANVQIFDAVLLMLCWSQMWNTMLMYELAKRASLIYTFAYSHICTLLSHLFAGLSEAAFALLVVEDGFAQFGFVEVGPVGVAEVEFGVGALPEQVVA